MKVSAAASPPADAEVLGVPVSATRDGTLGGPAGLAARDLEARGFRGKVGETCTVDVDGRTVVALGVGEGGEVTNDVLRRAAAALVRAAWRRRSVATTLLDALPPGADRAAAVAAVAEGAGLAAYRFTRFKSDPEPVRVESFTVVVEADVGDVLDRAEAVVEAVSLARDLVNTPPGELTPSDLAATAVEVGGRAGLSVEIVDEAAAVELGLGGLLGVARGSAEPPCLIRLRYEPEGATATVALVGKGITFDSGGLSLKTAEGMETMKTDMGGGAAVLAAMSALAAVGSPVRVIGLIPTTENMPGGKAIKPGDVLTTRSGTTVEVLNTDAEGRLILADGLALAVEEEVDAVIDLATLTGACMVALGMGIAGVMGTDEGLIARVGEAAARAGERVWPLPLPPDYRRKLDSDVADIKNIASTRYGGALFAGLFLREFVGDVPWAHIDIAGPARADEDDGPVAKGGTGFGVRTLLELLRTWPASTT